MDARVFAHDPAFRWYSDAGRFSPAAEDRETLPAFFAARHRAGERFVLKAYKYNSYRRTDRTGHYRFTLRRRTTAAPRWRTAVGKGAVDCRRHRIIVTSIAG